MEPLTLFTWGYWGWGTATGQLIQAVDAVEASRGFEPPLFVDIRISRSVRAPGFNGRAFERAVGPSRYRWLDALGNASVQDGGRGVRIKDPAAVDTLLDLARECVGRRQRLLFFCSCEFPGTEDQGGCHRVTVARLVLEAARRRYTPVHVVEWPGGELRPDGLKIQLSAEAFNKVRRGSSSIPLQEPVALPEMAGLPWYSLVSVSRMGAGQAPFLHRLSGPARYKSGGWYLPIYEEIASDRSPLDIRQRVQELRASRGFVAQKSGGRSPAT